MGYWSIANELKDIVAIIWAIMPIVNSMACCVSLYLHFKYMKKKLQMRRKILNPLSNLNWIRCFLEIKSSPPGFLFIIFCRKIHFLCAVFNVKNGPSQTFWMYNLILQVAKEMESTVPKIYKLLLILTMSFILLKTFLVLILVRTILPQPSIRYTL